MFEYCEKSLELDKQNGNIMWAYAIGKEMKNVQVPFKIDEGGSQLPIGYHLLSIM